MAEDTSHIDVLDDLQFLRRDNSNLLKEVKSLRQQSTLLRDRSDELERKLRDCLNGTPRQIQEITKRDSGQVVIFDPKAKAVPEIHLEIPPMRRPRPADKGAPDDDPDMSVVWFDDPTDPIPREAEFPGHVKLDNLLSVANGPQFIGEVPRVTPDMCAEEPSPNYTSAFSPPSPDPSERQTHMALPSLISVKAPVSGVAVPNVPFSLLELKLISKDTYDSPAAVSSFMHKLTKIPHAPQPTYRAAFTAAFLTLIPVLGPPGTLPLDWLNFLHDFPSHIPHSRRDSLVSLPWPDSGVLVPGSDVYGHPPAPSSYGHRRRSRSLDGIIPPRSPIYNPYLPPPSLSNDQQGPSFPPIGVPTGERDAWVLLLALAYAALPTSRVATKLRNLPLAVKLQMIAWLPPGVNVYTNMQFVSTAIDEALEQFWDAKKEILRLKHGWP